MDFKRTFDIITFPKIFFSQAFSYIELRDPYNNSTQNPIVVGPRKMPVTGQDDKMGNLLFSTTNTPREEMIEELLDSEEFSDAIVEMNYQLSMSNTSV